MAGALDRLVELLDVEPVGESVFVGTSPSDRSQRVFGGQVAGQAVVAAGRTVDANRRIHSLHAYFLRAGSPREPITYTVHATHDGRSFAARQVTASQAHGEIFTLSASFHRDESGLDHQQAMPAVPAPEATPTMAEQLAAAGEDPAKAWPAPGTIDLRPVPVPSGPDQACWMRADGPLPDDRLLHVAVLAYASDLNLLDAVLTRHHRSWEEPGFRGASLDHAMWFHRPFRADEWLLYAQRSPTAFGGRGLAVGEVWAADGRHVATVAQEGLLRFPG